MSHSFYVLLVDVVGSSRLEDRPALTRRLQRIVEQVNDRFAGSFYAPLEITRGDKMAAVLKSLVSGYEVISEVGRGLHPTISRMVIACGELSAGLETCRSTVIDGPAFDDAEQAMRRLKRSKRTFALMTGDPELDSPAEVMVNLLQDRWHRMTDLQRQIVRLYQRKRNQQQVGQKLGKSQQQVSQVLSAVKLELIDVTEDSVRHLFQCIEHRRQCVRTRFSGLAPVSLLSSWPLASENQEDVLREELAEVRQVHFPLEGVLRVGVAGPPAPRRC